MFEIEMLFAFAFFALGLYGISSRDDFLRIFFSLEILINSIIMMLAISAYHLGLAQNLVLSYMIIVIATLEAGVGLLIFSASNKIANIKSADKFEESSDDK